jgi:hypothetical protein
MQRSPLKAFFTVSDFLGFHFVSDLNLEAAADVEHPSMTLTTCLAICAAAAQPVQVAVLQDTRCICSKGERQGNNIFIERILTNQLIRPPPHPQKTEVIYSYVHTARHTYMADIGSRIKLCTIFQPIYNFAIYL